MSRPIYIVGNWKMNMSQKEINHFFEEISLQTSNTVHAWIAPQAIHIPLLLERAKQGPLKIGAQNCSENDWGAFTGETSAKSLKDLGASFTLIGHSERRAIFHENDQTLNQKVVKALEEGLKVIFCIGETLEERESGKTQDVLAKQLKEGLKGLNTKQQQQIILAYEPVWAIGTGKTATPEQAGETQHFIRRFINESLAFDAQSTPILYGGSVKPDNIAGLLAQKDIDGALVGGASLKAKDFNSLLKEALNC